jgi:hypothetical protein
MTTKTSEGWLLAGRLLGLLKQSGCASMRDASERTGVHWTVIFNATKGRQPEARTLRRILDGLGRSESDLLSAPDMPAGTRLDPRGRKPTTS